MNSLALLIAILQLKVQVLQLQLQMQQASDTAIVATTTPIVNATTTPLCPLFDAYGTPLFCQNAPLPSFCPSSSTIRSWNSFATGYNDYHNYMNSCDRDAWTAEVCGDNYKQALSSIGNLTNNQLVWCGMYPLRNY